MTKKELEAENKKLRKALLELVYYSDGKWRVGFHGDADVTKEVGKLLRDSQS